MAIKNLRPVFDGIYKALDPTNPKNRSKIARNLIERRFGHKSQINSIRFSQQMAISINNVVKQVGGSKDIATNEDVKAATLIVFKSRMSLKPFTDMSVKSEIKGDNLWVRRASKDSKKGNPEFFYNLNKVFKAEVFETWKTKYIVDHGTAGNKVDNVKADAVSLEKGIGFSHDKHSNVANSLLLDFIYDKHVEGDATDSISTVDVAKQIFSLLKIDWVQIEDPFLKDGTMIWQITGELAGHNEDFIDGTDLGQTWENHIMKRFQEVIDGKAGDKFRDGAFEACEPFTHKIATKEMRRIADEYLKERGFTKGGQKIKVKGVPKKPKKSKRQGTDKPRKPTIKSVVTKILAMKAVPVAKKSKGRGRQASTDGARELAKLRTYIQSRLPAEVRRNMGREGALRNRKGRFSNSVKLLSLHQAQKTVVAKYSYLLNPYQTFENTGERKWRLSYNPKLLIAKSIRKLATGRIQQKLTLRRV